MTDIVTKALVLHSGGVDSSTCLAMAITAHGRENVMAISIDYGQRHKKEITAAAQICELLDVAHAVYTIEGMPTSMLTDEKAEIPNASYDELEGVSPTYVPFRNGQLLSKITGIAAGLFSKTPEVQVAIYFGAHSEDALNWAYPDCTPEFIGAMANAIYIGTYHQVRLLTPLMWMMKWQIVQEGNRHGVPWALTWSCYAGADQHCGVCPTCRSRKDAFQKGGVIDPTHYAASPEKG